jgi:anti-sigma factor RsiW
MSAECRRWRQTLHEWLDGDTDEETALLAQAHWRTCPDCQRVVAEWQSIAEWLADALPSQVSPQWERRWRQRRQTLASPTLTWQGLAVSWLLTVVGCVAVVKLVDWSLTSFAQRLTVWLTSAVSFPTVPAEWVRQVWDWLLRSV